MDVRDADGGEMHDHLRRHRAHDATQGAHIQQIRPVNLDPLQDRREVRCCIIRQKEAVNCGSARDECLGEVRADKARAAGKQITHTTYWVFRGHGG